MYGKRVSPWFVFEKINERDMDFVLMRALSSPTFVDLFLRYTDWSGAKVLRVEHSLIDPEWGESDITAIVELSGIRYALLIENKIDAGAMPEQCLRYQKRGEIGVSAGLYNEFAVFLVAPQSYLDTNTEAKKYANRISCETLLTYFEQNDDLFAATVVKQAIKKKEMGYTVQEVPAITLFWQNLYVHTQATAPAVDMYSPTGAKGNRSAWPQFRVPLKGVSLFFKSNHGVVDLEFTGKQNDSVRLKTDMISFKDDDMHWVDTRKTVSLRIKVKPVDFRNPFEQSVKDIDLALAAVTRLTALAVKLNDTGYII